MLKKTITYVDYNDEERTEDFYFNLSKAELMEMEMGTEGGLYTKINTIINTKDVPSIIKMFKEIILKAYGEKSGDGRTFMKIDENGHPLSNKFMQTEAYSVLFMELSSDSKKAADFINGLVPKDLSKKGDLSLESAKITSVEFDKSEEKTTGV